MKRSGLSHEQSREITIDGLPAVQMEFSGDHWAVVIPRDGFAYVMMLGCRVSSCAEQRAIREETRDSFRISGS
jgi:predicted Zn-dependent protease